jgi:isopentenyl-diphosphate delta-isomerase
MGIKTEIFPVFSFIYKAEFQNNLIEHELDHVFIGFSDKKPKPNFNEVCSWSYEDETSLIKLLNDCPESFSPWFRICYERVFQKVYTQKNKKLIYHEFNI